MNRSAVPLAMDATLTEYNGLMTARLPARPHILLLKLDHIGDFLVGLRGSERLREGFPDASFTLVCGTWNVPWAEQIGWFDRIVPFDFFPAISADWNGPDEDTFDRFRALGLGSFDLAIDLRHDWDTRILLGLIDATYRVGFCAQPEMGGTLLDIALPNMEHISPETGTGVPVHAELRLSTLADVVLSVFGVRRLHPAARLVGTSELPPAFTVHADRDVVVLALGAGAPIRRWPTDRMTELGRRLIERHDVVVAVVGGPSDREDGASVAAALPPDRVIDLTGRLSLKALPTLIARARLFVGVDTGTTHLAAGIGTPTVVIFSGVAKPGIWAPVGEHVTTLVGMTACNGCRLVYPDECNYGLACMDVITVEAVLAAGEALMRSVPSVTPQPALRQAAESAG